MSTRAEGDPSIKRGHLQLVASQERPSVPADDWVSIDDLNIHYLVSGNPRSPHKVILLHGAMDKPDLSFKTTLLPLAEEGFHVFAPGLPGYWDSDAPNQYATEDYTDFLERFMDRFAIDKAHLVGLSKGGAIALGLSLRSPDRVRSLALVSSFGLSGDIHIPVIDDHDILRIPTTLPRRALLNHASVIIPALLGLRRVVPNTIQSRLVNRVVEHVVTNRGASRNGLYGEVRESLSQPRVWKTVGRWLKTELTPEGFRTDFRPQLSEIAVPTLVAHGTRDRIVPLQAALDAYSHIPNARLEVFEDAGHVIPRESPDFVPRLTRFLAA